MEKETTIKNKAYRKKRSNSICVDNEYLLYYLSDMGLLHYLRGISRHKADKDRRVWFFDNVPDVKDGIIKFRVKEKADQ